MHEVVEGGGAVFIGWRENPGVHCAAVRESSGVRLDDLASFANVSKQFVSDLENGKETIRLGLALKVLNEVGLHLTADLPDEALGTLERLRQAQVAHGHQQD